MLLKNMILFFSHTHTHTQRIRAPLDYRHHHHFVLSINLISVRGWPQRIRSRSQWHWCRFNHRLRNARSLTVRIKRVVVDVHGRLPCPVSRPFCSGGNAHQAQRVLCSKWAYAKRLVTIYADQRIAIQTAHADDSQQSCNAASQPRTYSSPLLILHTHKCSHIKPSTYMQSLNHSAAMDSDTHTPFERANGLNPRAASARHCDAITIACLLTQPNIGYEWSGKACVLTEFIAHLTPPSSSSLFVVIIAAVLCCVALRHLEKKDTQPRRAPKRARRR